jgi:hypothetical protein
MLFGQASVSVARPNEGISRVSSADTYEPRAPSVATIKGNVLLTPENFNVIMNGTGDYSFTGTLPSITMQGLHFKNVALTSLSLNLTPFRPIYADVEYSVYGGVSLSEMMYNSAPMSGLFISGDDAYSHDGTGYDALYTVSDVEPFDGLIPLYTSSSNFSQISNDLYSGKTIDSISISWDIQRVPYHKLGTEYPTEHRLRSLEVTTSLGYIDFKDMQFQNYIQGLVHLATGIEITLNDVTGRFGGTLAVSGQFENIDSSWALDSRGSIVIKQKIL